MRILLILTVAALLAAFTGPATFAAPPPANENPSDGPYTICINGWEWFYGGEGYGWRPTGSACHW